MSSFVTDWLIKKLLARLAGGLEDSGITLCCGSESAGASEPEARFVIALEDLRSLLSLARDPDLALGDLYSSGKLTVAGDLPRAIQELLEYDAKNSLATPLIPKVHLGESLRNDLGSSRKSAQHHYDVGNDFYKLFLDDGMVYTCAYFDDQNLSLEDAQIAKMDHVSRKVGLRSGHHVIEAGCGWGTLALHMARRYGVTVQAYNISAAQIEYAREEAEKQNLSNQVEFIQDDYRNATGRCDAFVSVGMLEHVGIAHYPDLGRVIDRVLSATGRGLIHSIGRSRSMSLQRWVEKRVFPNARPPTIKEMMDVFEPAGLVVLDIENLRRHYAITARHWYDRYAENRLQLAKLVSPEVLRTWEFYLAGTAASFEASTLELFQAVFTRIGNNSIPWTRRALYDSQTLNYG